MNRIYSKIIAIALMLTAGIFSLSAQEIDDYLGESCTSIMVGRDASVDGSVITSHTCDGRYRTWLDMVPAADYEDTVVTKLYTRYLRTETPWDMRGMVYKGSIPQAAHTYAYLNTAYPCMNEKQLAIGETTTAGKDTLRNSNGMFMIEELERIALQRCTTARQAIALIGEMIKEYGYGDGSECITIADTREVWHMEILGEGPDNIGGVWAAQRIPDGHVGISANIIRIGELDLKNKDEFMASKNVYKVAKKLGLWDGKETFKFWKAYGRRPKPFMIREFYILSTLAPSLNLSMEDDELPFSVKPEEKVSVFKISEFLRATYTATEYDLTKNMKIIVSKRDEDGEVIGKDTITSPAANPWMSRDAMSMYNGIKEETVNYQRTVSVSWCSYSTVIQLRDWLPDEVGGITWFAFDNPGQSPRIPIYSGTTSLPESFNYCGQKRYREDAALWSYRRANKLATVR